VGDGEELTGTEMKLVWLDGGVNSRTNGIVIWAGWIIKKGGIKEIVVGLL
jgi:hypothetical protein